MLLRKMRKKVKIIMWMTVIFIVPAFVWWGVGTRSALKENLLAKVDGQSITLEQFYNMYNLLYNRYALLFTNLENQQFQEKIRELNIEEEAFNLLVENILVSKEIKKRHIKISDQEVAESMKKLPFFLTPEGNFDRKEFERRIQNIPSSQWQLLEDQIRSKLAFEKLKKEIIAGAPENENEEVAYRKWLANLKAQAKIERKELPKLTE